MAPPALSILFPCRDAAATLALAMESLRAQTLADWELLAVNDGSTDSTPAILEKFARLEPRVRVLHQPRLGLVAALNRAWEAARAPLIARMDADDICHPERLARQWDALRRDPALDLVSCRTEFGGDPTRHAGYAAHVQWTNSLLDPEAHRLGRFVESPVAHPSVLWRRERLERLGRYRDGAFPEDYELWLRYLDAGARFAKLPEVLLTWNDSPARLSRADPRYATMAFYELKCQYLARILPPGRDIWLWGAGRVTRKRFASLERCRPFAGWIDLDPRRIGRTLHGRPVLGPDPLPGGLVLAGVGRRGARELVAARLREAGKKEGVDFWLCA